MEEGNSFSLCISAFISAQDLLRMGFKHEASKFASASIREAVSELSSPELSG